MHTYIGYPIKTISMAGVFMKTMLITIISTDLVINDILLQVLASINFRRSYMHLFTEIRLILEDLRNHPVKDHKRLLLVRCPKDVV